MIRRYALDRAASSRSYDSDGRLRVRDCRISRACVSPYRADEIPDPHGTLGLDSSKTYMLLRDPEELRRAAHTFAGCPILSTHMATSADDHPSALTVGAVGTNVKFDGEWLTADLVFWTADVIEAIESSEARDLSAGYSYVADLTPTTFRGTRADGVMRQIYGNHVAVIPAGRVEGAMVGDSALLHGRSKPVRHFSTFRAVYQAADAAIRKRRARDAEPAAEELDNEIATPEDLAAIVEEWCQDMEPAAVERLFERLREVKANLDTSEGLDEENAALWGAGGEAEDRTRRAAHAHSATRAHRAGDRHAADALPKGVKSGAERFPTLARIGSGDFGLF
jgi:hypothetical protein